MNAITSITDAVCAYANTRAEKDLSSAFVRQMAFNISTAINYGHRMVITWRERAEAARQTDPAPLIQALRGVAKEVHALADQIEQEAQRRAA